MNPNQQPASYSRPTQQTIETQSSASFWIIASVFSSLCAFFMFISAVLSLDTTTLFSPDKMMLCISTPLAIGFFLFASLSSQQFRQAKELDATGIITSGIVVELWRENGEYDYFAYHFTVSGSTFGAYKQTNSPKYSKLQVGDTITIRYLPTDPTKSRAEWP